MTQRTERIDEQLRQEIGQALEREVTDPRIGFVTVTKVETVPDLSRARVWVSIIGTPEERKLTLAALKGAMPFIRHGLGKKLTLRRIPELDVRIDDTIERGTRVLQILNELNSGQSPDPLPASGESLPTPVARVHHAGEMPEDSDLGRAAAEAEAASKARLRSPRPHDRHGGAERSASRRKPDSKRRPR
jgi:ribosome-binding factor A